MDEAVVSQLTEMGFHVNAAKRAVISSGNSGSEAATDWIMSHLDDANLNDPLEEVGSGSQGGGGGPFVPNEEAVMSIGAMGFTPEQAIRALKATDNNVERAVDWIFSHPDEMNSEDVGGAAATPKKCSDGAGSKS